MKTKLAFPICLLSLFFGAAAARSAQFKGVKFEQHKLSNGLTVVLHEDQSSPVVTVAIWYKVGSKNEEPGKTGFAHLFEHYMFEGDAYSEPGDYFKIIDSMGGNTNADTSYDRTYYFATVPPEGLEEILRLESNRMLTLREKINQQSLDKQRGIVINEKNLRENAPGGKEEMEFDKLVWGGPEHPYSHGIIGSIEDLNAASAEDVRRFHKTYYVPNNAVLAVSGRQNPGETLALVEKWFSGIPSGPDPMPVNAPSIKAGGRKEATLFDDKVASPQVTIAYPVPKRGKPGHMEITMAAEILAGNRSSRLVQSLQYEKRLVTSIQPGLYQLHEASVFFVKAVLAPGVTPGQVEQAVNEEIAFLVKNGITDDELETVKNQKKTAYIDSLQEVENIAAALTEGGALGNAAQGEVEFHEIVNMQPEAPRLAAEEYLTRDNSTVIVTYPDRKELNR